MFKVFLQLLRLSIAALVIIGPIYTSIAQRILLENYRLEIHDTQGHEVHILELDKKSYQFTKISKPDTSRYALIFDKVELRDLPKPTRIHYFKTKTQTFLINIIGTGLVFEFDPKRKRLQRLDMTFYRGFNFLPIQFYVRDTLFSFGGAGFWHSHNILSYYDAKNKGWELYFPKNKGPARFNGRIGGYHANSQSIYTVEMPDLYEDQVNNPSYVYVFDMKSKRWTLKGKLNTVPQVFWDHVRLETRWVDPFIFPSDDNQYFIDPAENKIYAFEKTKNKF